MIRKAGEIGKKTRERQRRAVREAQPARKRQGLRRGFKAPLVRKDNRY